MVPPLHAAAAAQTHPLLPATTCICTHLYLAVLCWRVLQVLNKPPHVIHAHTRALCPLSAAVRQPPFVDMFPTIASHAAVTTTRRGKGTKGPYLCVCVCAYVGAAGTGGRGMKARKARKASKPAAVVRCRKRRAAGGTTTPHVLEAGGGAIVACVRAPTYPRLAQPQAHAGCSGVFRL